VDLIIHLLKKNLIENMIKQSDITLIIPHLGETKEQEYAFDECYASLRESTPEIRIVVAKNGGACPHARDVRVLAQGQCKAVNAAVAITNTPWIMVSNDDMIYPPGWFERLTTTINDFYKPTCVSPKLVEPRPGAPTFETYFCGGAGGDFDKQKFFDYVKEYKEPLMPVRTGFNLPFIISRDIWDLVGGYDIAMDPFSSNSDSDLLYKIKLAGIQPFQNESCLVYHFSQTSGTFESQNRLYWEKNWQYFIEKWGFPRTDQGIWEATFIIPNEGRVFRPWWEGKYS